MRIPIALLLSLAACGPGEEMLPVVPDLPADASEALTAIPRESRPDTVDVASWNVEWFGDPRNGPSNEPLQQTNVARVLTQLDLDLVGLSEVVSEEAFGTLVTRLPGRKALLVTDPLVVGGKEFYSANEQKVALVYRSRFTVESARVVCTEAAWAFGGRPPLEVKLSFFEGGKPRTLVVIVAHFKAMANLDGYQRRITAAAALKKLLDTEYATRWVLVMGDLNDDIDKSTYRGNPSPFLSLVNDTAYRFTTDALTAANTSTTVSYSATIDHHLVTNELAERFVGDSAKVLRVDAYVPAYATNTSDHYPVLTRYDLR